MGQVNIIERKFLIGGLFLYFLYFLKLVSFLSFVLKIIKQNQYGIPSELLIGHL